MSIWYCLAHTHCVSGYLCLSFSSALNSSSSSWPLYPCGKPGSSSGFLLLLLEPWLLQAYDAWTNAWTISLSLCHSLPLKTKPNQKNSKNPLQLTVSTFSYEKFKQTGFITSSEVNKQTVKHYFVLGQDVKKIISSQTGTSISMREQMSGVKLQRAVAIRSQAHKQSLF